LNHHLERFTPLPAAQLAMGLAIVGAILVVGVGLTQGYTQVPLLLFPLLLILSLVGQSSDFLLVHFYGRILSVDIPVETLLIVVPLIFIAPVVPLTPGGHGVREVTLTTLLTLTGIPVSEAALVALMLFVTKNGFGLVCGATLIDGTHQFRKATLIVARLGRPSG
jgi:uncharacterized membrane protein YbhN (UPF0104 family)